MKGGKSRLQRVKVLASGKYKFVKNLVKGTKRSTKRKRQSNPKRRTRNLARKKKRRSGKSMTRTAFKFIRLGALVAPGASRALAHRDNPENAVKAGLLCYGGVNVDGQFDWGLLAQSWTPYLMACLTTYGIPKLVGIIRRL